MGVHTGGFWAMVRRALPVLLAVFLTGCGPSRPRLVPVSGTITVHNQPLPAGTVIFHPDAARGNTSQVEPRATIDSKEPGVYRLTTNDKDGAPLGAYRVMVYAMKAAGPMRPPEWLAHPKYTDVKTSGLAVEVVLDPKAGAYDFKLEPPTPQPLGCGQVSRAQVHFEKPARFFQISYLFTPPAAV